MFVRSLSDVEKTEYFVEWGAGTSHRLLTERDGAGYTICHTVVRTGTESLLQYRNHLEACYCNAGYGEVEDANGNIDPIDPGDMYALDRHDLHYVRGGKDTDLILVGVFNPALRGTARHKLDGSSGSAY